MKRLKIGLIHTSDKLVPLFSELCDTLLPHAESFHISDNDLLQHGTGNGAITERLQRHIRQAESLGGQAIMVTCSSIGPATEASQSMTNVPLIRVDLAMAKKAVAMATRIGVIATVSSTLGPTVELIERQARILGKTVTIDARLCEGALDAFLAGDVQSHDRMVMEQIRLLAPSVDVLVLAQASMSRVSDQLREGECQIPILTSPRIAVQELAKQFP